jgi:hypothetical protein
MDKKHNIKIEILYYDHMKVVYKEIQKYILLIHHFIMSLCFLEDIPLHNNRSIHTHNEEIFEVSGEDEKNSDKCVTAMNYFAYRFQVGRPEEALTLHWYGRLFQQ